MKATPSGPASTGTQTSSMALARPATSAAVSPCGQRQLASVATLSGNSVREPQAARTHLLCTVSDPATVHLTFARRAMRKAAIWSWLPLLRSSCEPAVPSVGSASACLAVKHSRGATAHRECIGCLHFRQVSSAQQLLQHLRRLAEVVNWLVMRPCGSHRYRWCPPKHKTGGGGGVIEPAGHPATPQTAVVLRGLAPRLCTPTAMPVVVPIDVDWSEAARA